MPAAGAAATVDHRGVEFAGYPFPAASVATGRALVPWVDVVAVASRRAPPEVRTAAGETLFVPASEAGALRAAAAAAGVPDLGYEDGDLEVWDLLLEPFLDTDFTDATRAQVDGRLRGVGFTQAEIDGLRARHGPAMVAYNLDSGLWDWVHLGLYDLLRAYRGDLAGPAFRLSDGAFAPLYAECQRLARRGWALPSPPRGPGAR